MRIEDGCILRSTADDQKNKAEQINNSVIGRTDAEPSILWSSDAMSQLIGKDPDAWKEWRKEVKGMLEDKMLGWHHRLNGHEFKQAPGDGEGQGSLPCGSPRGRKESDTTEQLNNSSRVLLGQWWIVWRVQHMWDPPWGHPWQGVCHSLGLLCKLIEARNSVI